MRTEKQNPVAGDDRAADFVIAGRAIDNQNNNQSAVELQVARLRRHYVLTDHLARVVAALVYPTRGTA